MVAREGAAVIDLPDRVLLAAGGPLRQKFLHNILSNDVASLRPGAGCRAALMDVKGRQLAFMRVLVDADTVLLELPADRLADVEAALEHYRVAAPVRFEKRPASMLALLGPQARAALARAGCELPELAPEAHTQCEVAGVKVRAARAGDFPCRGLVLYAPASDGARVREALVAAGADLLDRPTLDALRIEEGRAWYGTDVTEENLLHETGLLGEYHSPTKGCYVGQEVVARLEARGGNVNKLLRGLKLSAPAAAGATVRAEGAEAGRVTTAAVSPRLGPIAMAYVHRSRAEPGTVVEVDGAPATVMALPFQ
ncbi:MAG TPA: glycine cleavage T C-terminal barrel domain-containing protein [Vicinamibacteria bacterium]|nr:glycine cleavage T C-terminal barrel domain-containing protein [Vicinamibacteria bacterium]